jgi:hypothetical protein
MRKRIKTPLFSAKANGQLIRRTEAVISTHTRVKQILVELGGDSKQILRDLKWERLCKQAKLSPLWNQLFSYYLSY